MTLGVHVSVKSRIETAVGAISGEREDFGPLRPRKIAYVVIVRRRQVIICKREGPGFGKMPGLRA